MVNIAVLVSGGGTNLQALLDMQKAGLLKNGNITVVLSSRDDAYALVRAQQEGIPTEVVSRSEYISKSDYDTALLDALEPYNISLVVLAGFLSVLGSAFCDAYKNKIINVHPALIPAFCGEGYYGLHVHEQVIEYGVKVTGATVHFVTDVTDGGAIILQKAVDVHEGDTPETLQKRVMREAEWTLLPHAVSLFCQGKLTVKGRIVHIAE